MSKKIKLTNLYQDDRNNNKHTSVGMDLLEKSIQKVGIIESITISSDDKIISGNARHEIIGKNFDKEAIIIETDGTQPVIIRRTDIQSNTKEFYEASILANTTSKKNVEFDLDIIEEIETEFDVDAVDLGVDKYNSRMLNNSNYHNKNDEFEDVDNELYPITILQTKDEYDDFLKIKEKLNTTSSMIAFSKIIQILKNNDTIIY